MYTILTRVPGLINTGIKEPPNDCAEIVTLKPWGYVKRFDQVTPIVEELSKQEELSNGIVIRVSVTGDSYDEELILASDWPEYVRARNLIRKHTKQKYE